MNKICVYSCITNEYELRLNEQNFENADFYFFTDKEATATKPWREKKAVNLFTDPRRNARYHKLLSHEMFPEYDYSIWIDGSVVLKINPQDLVKEMGNADILTSYHPLRTKVVDEAEECKRLFLDIPSVIDTHVQKMFADGFKDNAGLAETKVVVRKNTPLVNEFNMIWFYTLVTGSLRDQLTFPYAVWTTGVKVKYMAPITLQPDKFSYIKAISHLTRNTYEAIS